MKKIKSSEKKGGLPNDIVFLKKTADGFRFKVDGNIYSPDAVKSTCYVFSDRCYVFIKNKTKNRYEIEMRFKQKGDVRELVGEFYNELLGNILRKSVSKYNKKIREYIVAKALFSAVDEDVISEKTSRKTSKKSRAKSSSAEFETDPLGIAMPWEEKYGKKK